MDEATAATAAEPNTTPSGAQERDRKRREAEIRQERYTKVKPLQKRLDVVEKNIAQREAEKAKLEEIMADPESYKGPDKIREVNTAYRTVGEKLQDLYHEWGKVSEELERLKAQFDAEKARR
jgi:ATP-binding cassette subfamily F protein 3